MEDFENVAIFKVKDKVYQFFVVYDGHGGRDPKTGIKKGGKEVALWCVDRLPTVIKDTLEKHNNNNIRTALIESFEKADKGKINCNYIYCNYN
jgi:serine/threonine protein phosphatase PrpC